jgi:DNA ligase-1
MNILETTTKFIEEMNKTNSTLDKKEVLKKFPEMKEMLEAVYNPFKMYYVSSANCKKNLTLIDSKARDIFDILSDLQTRRVTGHSAIALVNGFINNNKQYGDIIYKILDKDLECRVGDKVINDVYPGLIPTFEVALANSYEDVKNKIDLIKDCYYSSHKLDGCRCITVIDKSGDIKFYSRQGNEFETLGILRKEIIKMNLKNVVLDGEICIVDTNGKEDFQSIMKLIRKKDFDIPNPKYLVFDQIKYDDFFKQQSDTILSERLEYLKKTLNRYQGTILEMLPQIKIESMEQFIELSKEAEDKNWEGLILRKDTIYKGKRSNDLLKVKKMNDAEYKVIDIEFGPFRVIDKDTKLEKIIDTLTNVIIEHKGNKVSVGSGFTIEQRNEFYEKPENIKNMIITVKYFEETQNQDGKYSLRFPIFKGLHGNKRTI